MIGAALEQIIHGYKVDGLDPVLLSPTLEEGGVDSGGEIGNVGQSM